MGKTRDAGSASPSTATSGMKSGEPKKKGSSEKSKETVMMNGSHSNVDGKVASSDDGKREGRSGSRTKHRGRRSSRRGNSKEHHTVDEGSLSTQEEERNKKDGKKREKISQKDEKSHEKSKNEEKTNKKEKANPNDLEEGVKKGGQMSNTADISMQDAGIAKSDWEPSKILYSEDGKMLLAACGGNNVEVLSVNGGMTLFELEGHSAAVTDIALNPKDASQVYTSSLDGSIRLWNLTRGEAIKLWKCGYAIRHLLISPDGLKAYVTTRKVSAEDVEENKHESKTASNVYEITLGSKMHQQRRIFKCRHIARLALTTDGTLVAGAHKEIFIWRDGFTKPAKIRHQRDVCTVAVHSEQRFIVAGNDRGEIFFWYHALDNNPEEPAICSSARHWHAHPVRSTCISVEGAYLFSGGEEGVLVIWQLDSDKKSFIPRLGGPIECLCASPDGVHVAALVEGGRLVVVNTQARDMRTFRLVHTAMMLKTMDCGSVLGTAGGQGLIAVGGRETEVEVWDVKGTMVHHMHVMPRNYVSRQDDRPVSGTNVKLLAFSSDARALAVVHGRERGDANCQLSMWRLVQGVWEVESRVLSPHKDGITSLSFAPQQPEQKSALVVLSSGMDGLFKLWRRYVRPVAPSVNNKSNKVQEWMWRCHAVCGLRPVPCGAAAFGHDGSIVAAAYTSSISICASPSLTLLTTLTNTSCGQNVDKLVFLGQSTCLAAASQSWVTLWDVSSSSIRWMYNMSCIALAPHPTLPKLALSTQSGVAGGSSRHLLVCGVESASPLAAWQLEGGGGGTLVWSKGTGGSGGEVLYVLGAKGFVAVGAKSEEQRAGAGAQGSGDADDAEDAEAGVSAYAKMMGAVAGKKKKKQRAALQSALSAAEALSHLEGASHVLAAPSSLLRTFITALLPRQERIYSEGDHAGAGQSKGKAEEAGSGSRRRKSKGGDAAAHQDVDESDKRAAGGVQKEQQQSHGDQDKAAAAEHTLSFDMPAALDVFGS